ncbi:MAG: cupin domain-containing protein, partial [Hymenobacter sp.]
MSLTSFFEPQPQQGDKGGTDPGPRNVGRDRQNPDLLAPPSTDHGTVPNLWFSFSNAHNRLEHGGWAREVTSRELPIAKDLAGVNMRLNPGSQSGVRELHWHKQAEWAYMLDGRARLTAVDQEGRTFVGDVGKGDLWYFPAGIPHSIQAHQEGCEFLLVFDDGAFSENSTFLLTDWLAHTPRAVLAKNFGISEDLLKDIPQKERYI